MLLPLILVILVGFDLEALNDYASEQITNDSGGLVDIAYEVAGFVPALKEGGVLSGHVLIKVTAGVETDGLVE